MIGFIAVGLVMLFGFNGCKKFIEVEAPYTGFNGENVYTTDATAISAVTTMLTKIGNADASLSGIPSVTYNAGLSADELTLFPGGQSSLAGLYTNELIAVSAPSYWRNFYEHIYLANAAIEGLNASSSLTSGVKQQLLGEASFMRAFCYFYLVSLYGDVPLVVSTNYKQTSLLSRVTSSQIWQQIISDLLEAKNLLNSNFLENDLISTKPTTERVRPTKWAAIALLSRVYLYNKEYQKAEEQATELINNAILFNLSSLNNAFLKNSSVNKEPIWQIQTTTTGWNTNDARVFILPATGPNTTNYPVYISKRFRMDFETGDLRKTAWLDSVKVGVDTFYYVHKYKSATLNAAVTEYNTVFRLAEQYLIRAEARAQQGSINGAQNDLNAIRNRAGLGNTTANAQSTLLAAVFKERRFELFCEWGHRWMDLKRTNNVDAVMNIETPLKGGSWQTTDKFYPIPNEEILSNPNLFQTPGY